MQTQNISKRLEEVFNRIKEENKHIIGYPVSKDFDYSDLYDFLNYPINNVGDPFEEGTGKIQTHTLEREIIDFFARLFRANPLDYWGYVTNGGSEGNLYGLYLARELYPNAMVYFSESTHYSVKKNIHLLGIPNITIRSQENGEIDYQDLEDTLRFNRQKPAIILANFGTTMKEAKDNVAKIKGILRHLAIHDHYIHCDAALAGTYGNFISPRIPFDFQDGADSIAISGHKFIGSPFPCGIVMTRKSLKERISRSISYIGSHDTTISGSRNGHSVLFLWYALKKMGIKGLQSRYKHCLDVAQYCKNKLNEIGIPAWKNPGSITVVFPKVNKDVKEKWQLATDEEVTHIICMPNVTFSQMDEVVYDIANSNAQPEPNALPEFDFLYN